MILLGIMCSVTSCRRKETPVTPPVERAIELSDATVWPAQVKSGEQIPNGQVFAPGDGIVVWGTWHQDLGEGVIKSKPNVFGIGGTKAYYPDWSYFPKRFWAPANYTFASTLPASRFNASHNATGLEETGRTISGSFDGSELSLEFSGFDLSEDQTELMYTFATVDNTDDKADEITDGVSLYFENRLCAQLRLNMKSDGNTFFVKQVDIYGIHKSITGELEISTEEGLAAADFVGILTEASEENSPYATFSREEGSYWTISGEEATQLVPGILVLPETFSETSPMYVKVTYQSDDLRVNAMTFTLNTGSWEPNTINTYTLKASTLFIGEPIVTPWADGAAIPDIEIK